MELVYARQEHGGYPVKRIGNTITVSFPNGERVYKSVRKTIRAIVNNDPDLVRSAYKKFNYCWNRYFRLGKFRKQLNTALDTLTLFGNKTLGIKKLKAKPRKKSLTVVDDFSETGIDLNKRGHEVVKLFYAGFKDKVLALGYNPEDVLQEVFLGILQRNRTKARFNPERSAFSSYVFMVCGCVISNYNRKHKKFFNECYGAFSADGEVVDVSVSNLPVVFDSTYEEKNLKEALIKRVYRKASKTRKFTQEKVDLVLPLLFLGHKNKEISVQTGVSVNWVSSFLKLVRNSLDDVRLSDL